MDYFKARILSSENVSFLEKRQEYEILNIQELIRYRSSVRGYRAIHTVYQNSLSNTEFLELLRNVKHHFVEKGFKVNRVKHSSSKLYIFEIDWFKKEE